MMGPASVSQGELFYEFCLEDVVPADHLLRKIDAVLDLSWLRSELRPHYSHTGRPSVCPELMIRMLLVGYCYSIRSERRLCQEVELNLAYRWFCRLGLEDRVPDHSTFSVNRHGRFRESDLLRTVFEGVVCGFSAVRLVGGDATELGALGIEVIPDRWPGEGPLGGIATALAATAGDVMVVACDLPAVDRDTLERIALAGDLPGVDVAVGSTDRSQPLLARWNASSCDRVLEAMASGQRSPTDVLAGLEVAEVPIEEEVAVDVDDDHDLALWRRAHGRDDGVASRIEPMAVRDVTVEDLESALAAGATLIDVREPAEYAEARIEGSTLIPLSTVPDNVERFRSDSTVYVMCRSGGRSLAACEFVASLGLDVVNVEGGIMAWKMASPEDIVS